MIFIIRWTFAIVGWLSLWHVSGVTLFDWNMTVFWTVLGGVCLIAYGYMDCNNDAKKAGTGTQIFGIRL
jgi:hypothetical protein